MRCGKKGKLFEASVFGKNTKLGSKRIQIVGIQILFKAKVHPDGFVMRFVSQLRVQIENFPVICHTSLNLFLCGFFHVSNDNADRIVLIFRANFLQHRHFVGEYIIHTVHLFDDANLHLTQEHIGLRCLCKILHKGFKLWLMAVSDKVLTF